MPFQRQKKYGRIIERQNDWVVEQSGGRIIILRDGSVAKCSAEKIVHLQKVEKIILP